MTAPLTGAVAGTRPLVRLVLRRDRLRLPLWLGGITAVTWASANAVVGFYGTPEKQAGYAATVEDSAVSRLMGGVPRDVDTIGGIISFEVTSVAAVAVALMVTFLVVRHTRAEEESGRAELVRSTVVGRHAALVATLVVSLAASIVLGVLLAAVLVTADVTLGAAVRFGAGMAGAGVVFTGIAGVAAQVAGSARHALGWGVTAVLALFLVRGYGALDETWWTWASPFGWQDELRPFGDDARWWPLGLSVTAAAVALALACWLASHRDFGQGLVAERPGPEHAGAWLGTPAGLALRQQRGLVAGWGVGLLVLAVVFGAVSREVRTMIESNPEVAQMILAGIDDVVVGYLAYVVNFLGVTVSAYAVVSALRLRHEESSGQAVNVLATAVSRTRWALGGIAVTCGSTLGVLALTGLGVGVTHRWVGAEDSTVSGVGELLLAAVATAPAVLLLASVVFLLHGWAPRWVHLSWLPVAWALVQAYLGDLLDLPGWARGLSPFHHLPVMPAEDFRWAPAAALLTLAVVLTALGVVGLRRRDLD
ncbi:ABC transporter permease [Nocardioides jishulii]|uniref:Anibiotic ABC transporter n=1 Tax=Nocardioides jishulii TaxID=2575440 RepID=A0A4U2YSJ8_9ACTN|nr:hypothetical protein [Nocardioides jishulii]QCX26439.1 hypothetical protein FCL41_01940 [Nocardioides jishulii]TKI63755.1 hypothetical protein FC770_00765 [Nocardioides jishulii]